MKVYSQETRKSFFVQYITELAITGAIKGMSRGFICNYAMTLGLNF